MNYRTVSHWKSAGKSLIEENKFLLADLADVYLRSPRVFCLRLAGGGISR
jgi:hypothetical protein